MLRSQTVNSFIQTSKSWKTSPVWNQYSIFDLFMFPIISYDSCVGWAAKSGPDMSNLLGSTRLQGGAAFSKRLHGEGCPSLAGIAPVGRTSCRGTINSLKVVNREYTLRSSFSRFELSIFLDVFRLHRLCLNGSDEGPDRWKQVRETCSFHPALIHIVSRLLHVADV